MDPGEAGEAPAPAVASVLTLGVSPWMRTAASTSGEDMALSMPPQLPTSLPLSLPVPMKSPGALVMPPQVAATASPDVVDTAQNAAWPLAVRLAAPARSFAAAAGSVIGDGTDGDEGPGSVGGGGSVSGNGNSAPQSSAGVPTKEAKEREDRARKASRLRVEQRDLALTRRDDDLVRLSRKMLIIGVFCLPLVHFVQVWYFSKELQDSNANFFVRRHVYMAIICGTLQTAIAITWFVVFQKMRDTFEPINILNSNFPIVSSLT
jgi:Presenilin enhancer-2 subunit of gamma secretase